MSATLRDRHGLAGPAGGGVGARRAVAGWAWRLFRRGWRQQILVLALLILTVAAAAFSVSAAYNVASLPGPLFGSANHMLQLNGTNPKAMAADIAAARKAFGTIQVIGRRFVPIPGSAQTVEFRAQNPHGPYSDPMLALTQGRYPTGAGQAAITGQIAQTLQLHIGSLLSIGGHHQTVTGIVENPSDLSDQFVLVSPSGAGPPQSVTVLLNASPVSFGAFRTGFRGPLEWQARGPSTQAAVAGGMLGAVTVLLLLVSLVAAAGFAVIAARRQRQLGMLAASGATRKQLRMVMVSGGAVVGVIPAVAGTAAGLAAWLAAAPGLDTFGGCRSGWGGACGTSPVTRAGRGRPWPRSASPWGSLRRSSSARPATSPPPMRATCRTPRSWSGSASQRPEMARMVRSSRSGRSPSCASWPLPCTRSPDRCITPK